MVSKTNLDKISELFKASANTALTIKNKNHQWNVFSEFCETYDLIPVPASSETLVRYAVYLMLQRRCCERTVRNHLSNICRYHKMYLNIDIPSPTQHPPLDAVLKGGAKYLGESVQQKFPVTANILSALVITLPQESPYRSLYNLLFFGLPRVGNILPQVSYKFSKEKHERR